MSRSLLLSDVHLGPDLPRCQAGLHQLLSTLPDDVTEVFLLGDLFEVWVGDDYDSPEIAVFRDDLKALAARGVAVHFCHGNRDFLVGAAFAAAAHCRLMAESEVIERHGQRVLLMHGDALCTDDVAYQAFRAQSRSPEWRAGVITQPLAQRLMLAQFMRAKSQAENSNKAEHIMDVNAAAVTEAFATHGVTQLVHGHTHRPGCHETEVGTRWVLGDWREDTGEAVIGWWDASGIRLETVAF